MYLINRESELWNYLQPEIRELISDGEHLAKAVEGLGLSDKIGDFSFLVFSFSKAYEGFLKKLLLDVGAIQYDDYYGDDIRIGRILNPGYQHEDVNVFSKLCNTLVDGRRLSESMWETWKNARNLNFHFFPHNYKKLSHEEAIAQIKNVIDVMEDAVSVCELGKLKK